MIDRIKRVGKQVIGGVRRRKLLTAFVLLSLIGFWLMLPSELFKVPKGYVLEDGEGNLLNAVIASDGQWRFPYNENVPARFADCITAYEDRRFYMHSGVDLKAIGRAISSNVRKNGYRQGGSTLTMQVMRLSGQNARRSLWNKFTESILAVRLECSYSKKEILALYASNAPFGSNVVGLDAAAWRYFGRAPDKLSWAESAMLAVLPNSPALIHPGKNRAALLAKRNGLIDELARAGKIEGEEAMLAKQEPLPDKPHRLPQFAPHLLQFLKTTNAKQGIRLRSTINGELQLNVLAALNRHAQALRGNNINNMCALVADVETGKILAYVGNISAREKNLEADVDVIQARRSPGSVLKPLLYASVLSDGLLLPNSLIPDIPTRIGGYAPQNFDLGYDGAVPASRALSRSLNVPAVKMLQQYKYQRFYETLAQCGIKTLNNPADFYGLSMILGGCEIKMWEAAGTYASLARVLNHQNKNKGVINPTDYHGLTFYDEASVFTKSQSLIPDPQSPALDATSIYFTFNAMQEVMRPGEEGLWQQFSSSQRIAWKTGTSFGFRDAWAIGITPNYVVAVWAGNTSGEGRPGLTGVQTAAPLMFDIFRFLPASGTWFRKPQYNYVYVPVCRKSGYRANTDCDIVDTLMMPPNALRAPLCAWHRMIHLDAAGIYRVTEACESPVNMQHQSRFVLPPAMEFYYRARNADYAMLPPFKPGCESGEPQKMMELIYPPENAKIFVPKELSGEKGNTVFKAAHRDPNAKIFWTIDNNFVGSTEKFHQLGLNPAPGRHLITLTDRDGNSVARSFEIISK